MTLAKARDMGINHVLITCEQDNFASARVIQKNQGQLASEGILEHSDKVISRYWIDL